MVVVIGIGLSKLERNLEEGSKKMVMQQSVVQSGKPPKIEYMEFDYGTKAAIFSVRLSTIKANEKRLL